MFRKATEQKNQLEPLISTKTFKSLQNIKPGDTLAQALGKLYALMKEHIDADKEKEEREEEKERRHKEILDAVVGKRRGKKKEKKAEETKVPKEKGPEAPKAPAPTTEKVTKKAPVSKPEVPKAPAPTAEKVTTKPAVSKPEAPKAEPITTKPPAPKPSAEPAISKPSTGSKAIGVAKTVVGAVGKPGVIAALAAAGFSKSAQANVLANVEEESRFKPQSEQLEKYSAKTLFKMYGPPGVDGGQPTGGKNKVRFQTMSDAQAVVAQGPSAVGDVIYGGRMVTNIVVVVIYKSPAKICTKLLVIRLVLTSLKIQTWQMILILPLKLYLHFSN